MKHRVVVETELVGAGNTRVARHQETPPVVAANLAPWRPDPQSAVEAISLAVLVRRAGPIP